MPSRRHDEMDLDVDLDVDVDLDAACRTTQAQQAVE